MTHDQFNELVNGFRLSRVILTAFELNIFAALGNERRSSADVAAAIHADERALDRLMNVLVGIGILDKSEGLFANTSFSLSHLVPGAFGFLGGMGHLANLWKSWSTMTEAVRQGTAVVHADEEKNDASWFEAFIAAMHARGKTQSPVQVRRIDLTGVKRVLDIGGGSGVFAVEMLRRKSDMTATVFDLPNVTPITMRHCAEEGFAHRVETVSGNYLLDPLPEGYDLLFLSAVIHSNSPEENRLLLQKCARSCNPGGKVVVQDFIMDDDRVRPVNGALFSLNMLVGTERGDTYTENEVREWMTDAGLVGITRNDAPFGVTQITGRKG